MSDKDVKFEKDERDALEIINDPKYHITANEKEQEASGGLSRRDLLKYGGAAAAALSMAGSAATGMATGRSADAYTGFGRQFLGKDQFFNREPFRAEVAAMMEQTGPASRPEWHEYYLRRWKASRALVAQKKWNPKMGIEAMEGYLGDFYRSHPEEYKYFLECLTLSQKRAKYMNQGKGYDQYQLSTAYVQSYVATGNTFLGHPLPESAVDKMRLTGKIQPPEEFDFRHVKKNRKKLEFKTPAHASELIKTITHRFGASFVGITKFDERFFFKDTMRGYPNDGIGYGDKVPEHWKSVVVFGVPMEWDRMHAAAGFLSAQDGYFRVRVVAALLERFLQEIGYSGRPQTPGSTNETSLTPYILASGLGEYARAGFAMIPEVGANFRSGCVFTNLEFEYDKPINIGMAKFCKKCKICADTCPSGAIETGDEPKGEIRGVRRWKLDYEKCHVGWQSTVDGGCGTCVAVCPFTRKNTWIHAISRELDARDSFGIVGSTLLTMQLNFFKYPKAEEFMGEFAGGSDAVYHNPPEWQKTENWFSNINVDWDYEGMH